MTLVPPPIQDYTLNEANKFTPRWTLWFQKLQQAVNAASGGGVTDGDKGDITVSGSGTVWTIDNAAVTLAKMQQVSTGILLGRSTAGTGVIEQITVGAGLSLSAGTLTGTGLSDGDKGDINVTASGATWTIDSNVVTFAKMQDVSTGILLGRSTAGTGDPEQITIGAGLSLAAGVLSASGGGSVNSGQVTVDFGSSAAEDDSATVTVPAAWVLAGSIITVSPAAVATADHDPDDYFAENIKAYPTNIVAGVSFDIVATAPNLTFGEYQINYHGV